MSSRNVFDQNKEEPETGADFDGEVVKIFPRPPEGHHYELASLDTGETSMILKKTAEKAYNPPRDAQVCNCGKYQSCPKCNFYGTVTERPSDGEILRRSTGYGA